VNWTILHYLCCILYFIICNYLSLAREKNERIDLFFLISTFAFYQLSEKYLDFYHINPSTQEISNGILVLLVAYITIASIRYLILRFSRFLAILSNVDHTTLSIHFNESIMHHINVFSISSLFIVTNARRYAESFNQIHDLLLKFEGCLTRQDFAFGVPHQSRVHINTYQQGFLTIDWFKKSAIRSRLKIKIAKYLWKEVQISFSTL